MKPRVVVWQAFTFLAELSERLMDAFDWIATRVMPDDLDESEDETEYVSESNGHSDLEVTRELADRIHEASRY